MSYGIYLNQIIGTMLATNNDTVSFQYVKGERTYTIQTGHTTLEQLQSLDAWRSVLWLFKGERDGVLIYEYNGAYPEDLVDVEPMLHTLYPESFMWITPKGFPRPQPTLWKPLCKSLTATHSSNALRH